MGLPILSRFRRNPDAPNRNAAGLFSIIVLVTTAPLRADDFYRGKTIRVIVGGSAGGGFDIYTRAMARHMGKHIPGNPTMVVENMTGAGTLIAAKYLHSSAKPDGLSFGIFNGALILSGVLGNKSIDFDMRELEYLGVPVQDNTVCALRKESGVTQYGSVVRVEVADQTRRPEPRQ